MPRPVSIPLQIPLPLCADSHSPAFPSTDWQLWTAATLTDATLRTTMITLVKKYASSRINDGPFPDRYSSENGKVVSFENRAVVGGHFALVRRLVSMPRGAWELIHLILFSSLFPVSRMGAPAVVVMAVASVVEAMGIPVWRQPLSLQLCSWRWRFSSPSSARYSDAQPLSIPRGSVVRYD